MADTSIMEIKLGQMPLTAICYNNQNEAADSYVIKRLSVSEESNKTGKNIGLVSMDICCLNTTTFIVEKLN